MSKTYYFNTTGSRCCLRFYMPDGLKLADVVKAADDAKACVAVMQQAFPPELPSVRIGEPTLQTNNNGAYWLIVVNVNTSTLAGGSVPHIIGSLDTFRRGLRTLLAAQGFGRGK